MTDFQRKKVYRWERHVIAPLSKRSIPFEEAQAFVDGIWLAHGWFYPPRVSRMPKQAKKAWATGIRWEIRIQESTPEWVILHELAHVLTSDEEGRNDGHGSKFVGIYIKLLDKILNVPLLMSIYTLERDEIRFSLTAIPWMQRRSK